MKTARYLLVLAALAAGCAGGPVDGQSWPDAAPDADARAEVPTPDGLPETADSVVPVYDFAAPDALPEAPEPPALLTALDGTAITTAAQWTEKRQPEIEALLNHYVYGSAPAPRAVTVGAVASTTVLGGSVVLDQLTVTLDGAAEHPMHLAIFRPPGDGPFPVWIAPNACGNQAILDDPAIRATTAWRASFCEGATVEESRGSRASRFPVAQIVEAGWALAAVHESDIAPDDAAADRVGFRAAIRAADGAEASWGVLQAWAYGVAHIARAVPQISGLDGARIAVIGHSRRGKAALLAGAMEPRIALVVSHQSGTAGGRMSRSPVGESVQAITLIFPHWFGPRFAEFATRESYLPLDQHFLLARIAPRPLLLTNGAEDLWAGPEGTRWAAELASPAWQLLGAPALGEDGDLTRPLAYHVRAGGHSLSSEDWTVFLEFAQAQIAAP
ncbi:MAG: hypothetical protein R3F39_19225 [Myxococcota bacterium]